MKSYLGLVYLKKFAYTDTCQNSIPNKERITGVEPASLAWEANALPMCYIRKRLQR